MTLAAVGYVTKKALKESSGKPLRYKETSLFGSEYTPNGKFIVVGNNRAWFASVTMENGLISKVT
jgi:hypothetical protein